MGNVIHNTIPIKVWVDVDEGIAKFIENLNKIPGVRTYACCQGTMGEGGYEPYEAYVRVGWCHDEAKRALEKYNLEVEGEAFGTVHPNKFQLNN